MPQSKKSRRPLMLACNLYVLDYTMKDVTPAKVIQSSQLALPVTPVATVQPSFENPISTPIATVHPSHEDAISTPTTTQIHEANVFIPSQMTVTSDEIFADKDPSLIQGVKETGTNASASLDFTYPSLPSNDASQPNLIDSSTLVDSTLPSSSLPNSFLLSDRSLESVKVVSQTLSDITNLSQSSTSDPIMLRVCSAFGKLMGEFPSDAAARNEVLSQVDSGFHVALDVLVIIYLTLFLLYLFVLLVS